MSLHAAHADDYYADPPDPNDESPEESGVEDDEDTEDDFDEEEEDDDNEADLEDDDFDIDVELEDPDPDSDEEADIDPDELLKDPRYDCSAGEFAKSQSDFRRLK